MREVGDVERSAPVARRSPVIVDRYTRVVLTVIAVALTVIAVRPWIPEPGPALAQSPVPRYEVAIPKDWGKFVAFSNNNFLLEAPDKSLRIVDVEGKSPEYPKVKAHIRWQ
jgi:hypothetical protein